MARELSELACYEFCVLFPPPTQRPRDATQQFLIIYGSGCSEPEIELEQENTKLPTAGAKKRITGSMN